MADRKTWTERVQEWRASGMKAEAFCAGRGFSPQTLYRWSSRVGGPAGEKPAAPVLMARVIRRSESLKASSSAPGAPVWVELAGARIEVAPGVDRTTLIAVLQALRASVSGVAR